MRNLTPKMRRFVENRVAGLNGAAAAIAAGYSPAGAKVAAAKLMANPKVKAAIAAGKRKGGKVAPQDDGDRGFGLRDKYATGLELLQHAYNNPRLPVGIRLDCAKQAMPYESPRIGETGKKQKATDRAGEIANGKGERKSKFQTRQAPKLKLVGGSSSK